MPFLLLSLKLGIMPLYLAEKTHNFSDAALGLQNQQTRSTALLASLPPSKYHEETPAWCELDYR